MSTLRRTDSADYEKSREVERVSEPIWKIKRCLEMADYFESLTEEEARFLLWLAGQDIWAMEQFLSIASKFKK